MTKPTKDELRHAAIARHYRDESALFSLKPWETRPVHAGGEPPADDGTMRARTWAKARALRDELLKENPKHYADTGE